MPKTKRPRRLSKTRLMETDYVVQVIQGAREEFHYFEKRSDVRDYVKRVRALGVDRVRVARLRQELVSDTGAKRGRK